MNRQRSRGLAVSPIIWGALALASAHFILVLITGDAAQPGVLAFIRALLSCLLLPVPGLPLALLLLGRDARRRAGGEVGLFALGALSFGLSLILFYVLAVIVRSVHPPATGAQFSLLALAAAAAALIASRRLERGVRMVPEIGLAPGPVLLALAVLLAISAVGRHRLFGGAGRFIVLDEAAREKANEVDHDQELVNLTVLGGAKARDEQRYILTSGVATLMLENGGEEPIRARLAIGFIAAVESQFELWSVPGSVCGLKQGGGEERRLTQAAVPSQVLEIDIGPVQPRWSGLLLATPDLPATGACFQVRLLTPQPRGLAPAEIIDLSSESFSGWDLLGSRMSWVAEGTAECHLSDARYRAEMRTSNQISPQLLLWGYFTQLTAELLSGARDPMLGLLFLTLAFAGFCATLVMIGAAGDALKPGAIGHRAGYLLVGPFICHLHSLAWIDTYSFAFPDSSFTFLVLSALALLLTRSRAGFIVLGCLAAFARYPGAYIMAVALLSYLALFKEHRPWSKKTLAWALAAAAAVIGVLMLHFALTLGVRSFLQAVYENAAPAWQRAGFFLYKLSAYAGLTVALWPLIRHRAGIVLVAVTAAYTLPLIGVHVAHSHYFPVLYYCAAGAGLGALARREKRWWLLAGLVLVAAGTALGIQTIDW